MTLGALIEDCWTLIGATCLCSIMQHIHVAAFRTLLLDLHLLWSNLALSFSVGMILIKPLLSLSDKYFGGYGLPRELLERVLSSASEARDLEGVGLQIQQLSALLAEVCGCCCAVHILYSVLIVISSQRWRSVIPIDDWSLSNSRAPPISNATLNSSQILWLARASWFCNSTRYLSSCSTFYSWVIVGLTCALVSVPNSVSEILLRRISKVASLSYLFLN